ncbi:MAG TPA: hypothetical protein VG125_30205 [Pirellulales bacterium]|nr:hypothetical protein [Pirellulales bacterium]
MSRDLFTLPPGWEGVDATLDQLRTNTGALGEFLQRQWEEMAVLKQALAERARGLEHREREVQRKEQELAATLKLAKLYTEFAQMRCGSMSQQQDHGKVDSALLAASARIIELEQKVEVGESGRGALNALTIG